MNRRLLLVVLLVVIVVGVAIALVLVTGNTTPTQIAQGTPGGGQAAPPAQRGDATALPSPTPIPYVEIAIAIQNIPRGVLIAPNAVTLTRWPEEVAPQLAYNNLESVIGKVARTDIYREQPILQTMLVEDKLSLASVGSDAAAVLPSTRVAVAVPIDRLTSVAYALQPGDRVDVIISMLFIDVDATYQSIEPNSLQILSITQAVDEEGNESVTIMPGTELNGEIDTRIIPLPNGGGRAMPVVVSPSEAQRPRLATQRTIQDALVIWLGDFPTDGRIFAPAPPPTPTPLPDAPAQPTAQGNRTNATPTNTPLPPRPDIITIGVSPQDAVVLTWLVEAGMPVTFALRSAASTSLVPTDAVSMTYIMNRFNIVVPDKFDYNIEPAIRSIRELSAGDRIQLQTEE